MKRKFLSLAILAVFSESNLKIDYSPSPPCWMASTRLPMITALSSDICRRKRKYGSRAPLETTIRQDRASSLKRSGLRAD